MIRIELTMRNEEELDRMGEIVRDSPGFIEMVIDDIESLSDEDPIARLQILFRTEKDALWFQLKTANE